MGKFVRAVMVPMIAVVALVAGAAAAGAAPARPGGDPVVPANQPVAAAHPEAGVQAAQDGIWHVGEIGLWRNSGFSGYLYDTAATIIYNYAPSHFVNSNITLNDQVSSIANAQNGYRWAYEHAGYSGGSVVMLPYGQCNASTCYSYTSLGWANDRLSSHAYY